MRIPIIQGLIKRRLLVNYRADPEVVQQLLPSPFRPKLFGEQAMIGICLIRLEQVRPRSLPAWLGISSENAAHRFAVEWDDATGIQEGVYIPRRDTGSRLNHWAGGRIFPGEHSLAKFVVSDHADQIDLAMNSIDGKVKVHVIGEAASELPTSSCFPDLVTASAFFQQGCLGYSATCQPGRLDGLILKIDNWKVRPFAVSQLCSSYFEDQGRFPAGSIEFDHALLMRDIPHEWRQAEDLYVTPAAGMLQAVSSG